jgi:protein involved in polysaccharide export with SLBB domain
MNTMIYCRFLRLLLFIVGALGIAIPASADSSIGHVYLSGEVHQQGAVEIPAGGKLTVSQAIIADGGLTDFADSRHITILRKNADGTSQVIHVDWIKIMGGNIGTSGYPYDMPPHLDNDVPIQAGDTIVVPKRLANF